MRANFCISIGDGFVWGRIPGIHLFDIHWMLCPIGKHLRDVERWNNECIRFVETNKVMSIVYIVYCGFGEIADKWRRVAKHKNVF